MSERQLQPTLLRQRLDLLEESVISAIHPMSGGLFVIAGSGGNLSAASYFLELIKQKMTVRGLPFIDVGNDQSLAVPQGVLMVFSELREQDAPQHSTDLAIRYLEAGATVLAVVHGLKLEGVQQRLVQLGVPLEIAESVTVVEYVDSVLMEPALQEARNALKACAGLPDGIRGYDEYSPMSAVSEKLMGKRIVSVEASSFNTIRIVLDDGLAVTLTPSGIEGDDLDISVVKQEDTNAI